MEDQRAEEIWWQNEIRSGRDPSKGCGCPMDRDTFENVKLLAPILFLLFGVTVLFAVVAGVLYDLAGYAVKIPGLILISLFVMAMIIYALWPLVLHKNEQTFEKDQIELAETYSIELEAHHILKWSEYPRGRIDLKNGMCLCAKCHAKQHEGEPAERLILSKAGKRSGS